MLSFKERYRNNDVLLIDDIQFIAGKERTQEEFFHTFNSLYDTHKQIIISADCPPREIPTLEERLHSRFEWGLIADIQPPGSRNEGRHHQERRRSGRTSCIPDNVALYIASKIKSNIRELEGALVRLIAYCSLKGSEITLAMAQETLHDILGSGDTAINDRNDPENDRRSLQNAGSGSEVEEQFKVGCVAPADLHVSLQETDRRFTASDRQGIRQ